MFEKKKIQHEAELTHQKLLALESTQAQEEERKRIAILVHDDIGNRLNILSLWIHNLDSENKEEVEKIITKQISELIDSARSISHSLYPVNLEKLGLILYTEELITNLSNRIKINMNINGGYEKKNVFTEVQLYRIIQEFTTNVLKHTTATEINITIRDIKGWTAMIIQDNGESFDYEKAKKGMGLKNIDSRIKTINGISKWKNKIGIGSNLIILIPHKK